MPTSQGKGQQSWWSKDTSYANQIQKFDEVKKSFFESSKNEVKVLSTGGKISSSHLNSKPEDKSERTMAINQNFRSALVNLIMQSDDLSDDTQLTPKSSISKDNMQRYYYYITNGVDTSQIADMDEHLLKNMMRLISPKLKGNGQLVESLSIEIREDYNLSVKKAIVDFVLKDRNEQLSNFSDQDNDNSPTSFVNIRSSASSWEQDYKLSRNCIKQNLLLYNEIIDNVYVQWSQNSQLTLIDLDYIRSNGPAPLELRQFKQMILQKFEKTFEKILNGWYPAIINTFYLSKPNSKNWIGNERVANFFNLVNFILESQLTEIIGQSIPEFLNLFQADDPGYTILVKFILAETEIRMEPSLTEILTTCKSLLDNLLLALEKVPKVQTQIFVTGKDNPNQQQQQQQPPSTPQLQPQQQEKNLSSSVNYKSRLKAPSAEKFIVIDYERKYPNVVKEAKIKLRQRITEIFTKCIDHIQVFNSHKPLITNQLQQVNDEFLKKEFSFDEFQQEIQKYRTLSSTLLSTFPNYVFFPLVTLQQEDLVKALSERAIQLGNDILNIMAIENRKINLDICSEFELIAKNLTTAPSSVEEMTKLSRH